MFKPMWILAMLFRPLRLVLLGLLIAATVLGLIYGPWISAQARTVGALSTAYDTPLLSWVTQKVTDEPRLVNTSIDGLDVTFVNPAGEGPWPTVLLLNGATERGRFDGGVVRLAMGLARVGHRVAIMDSPDAATGDFAASTEADTMRVARALAAAPQTRDGELSLIGLGLGGTLALLAAQDAQLAPSVPLVVAVSPLTDLVEIGRLATTGFHRRGDGFTRLPVPNELVQTAANLLLEALPAGPPRDLLRTEIRAALNREAGEGTNEEGAAAASSDPFARLAELPKGLLDEETQTVVDLLANDDPEAYDALYAALPAETRRSLERLSPVRDARRLQARVELATAARDPLVPFAQGEALQQAAPDVRITISDAFSSTQSRPSLGGPGDFLRVDALFVRSLHEIRNH